MRTKKPKYGTDQIRFVSYSKNVVNDKYVFFFSSYKLKDTQLRRRLKHYATSRNVVGLIAEEVIRNLNYI
jgi:hypothetical protein